MGLNPPEEGTIAFHMTKDGTDRCRLDVSRWENELRNLKTDSDEGDHLQSWLEAMKRMGDDTNRLLLLNMASTVQMSALQYLDDMRCKRQLRACSMQLTRCVQSCALGLAKQSSSVSASLQNCLYNALVKAHSGLHVTTAWGFHWTPTCRWHL